MYGYCHVPSLVGAKDFSVRYSSSHHELEVGPGQKLQPETGPPDKIANNAKKYRTTDTTEFCTSAIQWQHGETTDRGKISLHVHASNAKNARRARQTVMKRAGTRDGS
eukprot:3009684-Pleurochrysis_carterae.AAC.2